MHVHATLIHCGQALEKKKSLTFDWHHAAVALSCNHSYLHSHSVKAEWPSVMLLDASLHREQEARNTRTRYARLGACACCTCPLHSAHGKAGDDPAVGPPENHMQNMLDGRAHRHRPPPAPRPLAVHQIPRYTAHRRAPPPSMVEGEVGGSASGGAQGRQLPLRTAAL